MSIDELIDSHVSTDQCTKAVTALRTHALKIAKQREEKELLPGKEDNVWLVLTVKKTYPGKSLKPSKIPIVHPIVDPRTTSICLITKDPQREYKDLLASQNIKFISRVVGITKLKGKFKPYEARRMLLKENGMFLADERVVPLLPGLLGKKFFDAKKQPIPVCLTRKDLKGELERAVSSTYMHQNQGTCTSIKIATVSQALDEVLANLKSALPAIVKNINGGWDNVQSFNIKTNSSVSLPVWSCKLGHGESARWDELPAADESPVNWTGFGEDGKSETVKDGDEAKNLPAESAVKKTKGKKRGAEGEGEGPVKKAKQAVKEAEVEMATGAQTQDVSRPAKKTKSAENSEKASPADAHTTNGPELPISKIAAELAISSLDPPTKRPKKNSKKVKAADPVTVTSVVAVGALTENPEQMGGGGDIEMTSAPVKKRKKKTKVIASTPLVDTAPVEAPADELAPEKATGVDDGEVTTTPIKKKRRKSKANVPAPLTSDITEPSISFSKAEALSAAAAESQSRPSTPGLSKEELKQKRGASGMEKKKDKVTKGKSGKAAKESIVGKAAKARP